MILVFHKISQILRYQRTSCHYKSFLRNMKRI